MKITKTGGEFAEVTRFLNEAPTVPALAEALAGAGLRLDASAVFAAKATAGGAFKDAQSAGLDRAALTQLGVYLSRQAAAAQIEQERTHFKALLVANPNYFGTLVGSQLKPVKPKSGDISYEQLICGGLDTPYDRLHAVIQVKKSAGYGGTLCGAGSFEYVRSVENHHPAITGGVAAGI